MTDHERTMTAKLERARGLVSIYLPYLSALAETIRLRLDGRIRTACVFPSGLVLVSPSFVEALSLDDLLFVVAHEILHLALRTHDRASELDKHLFNLAHDYVINDILVHDLRREELERPVPANGLRRDGARRESAESIVVKLVAQGSAKRRTGVAARSGFAHPGPRTAGSTMEEALARAGLGERSSPDDGAGGARDRAGAQEVLDPVHDAVERELERRLFPGSSPLELEERRLRVAAAAGTALGLRAVKERLCGLVQRVAGTGHCDGVMEVGALLRDHRPSWERAIQKWFDDVTPAGRTYARRSRRLGGRSDVVLPGRNREGWTLNLVLDTSGSMTSPGLFERALGSLAVFCESAAVESVRMVQCDTVVTVDARVTPEELGSYTIAGCGGSDMTPAMEMLAEDARVEAAVVLTDGAIEYPRTAPPYEVLWAIIGGYGFEAGYGTVIPLRLP